MNTLLIIASVLSVLLGVVHSILGELLIFQHIKSDAQFSEAFRELIPNRRQGIIRASWHLVTLFGFAIAAVLFYFAKTDFPFPDVIRYSLGATMFSSVLLVIIWTKAKHPGWIVLLIIGSLILLA